MKKNILLLLSILALSACSSVNDGKMENIEIASMPEGATIIINGENVGTTPATVQLPGNLAAKVQIQKEGYLIEDIILTPSTSKDVVKFGLLVDTGYYETLQPSKVKANLKPAQLPSVAGLNPFNEMAKIINAIDKELKDGKISSEEHSYKLYQVIEFYEAK